VKTIFSSLLALLSLMFAGCSLLLPAPELDPGEVTGRFYRWHIGYPGNSLVDRAYRESPYLADAFIQRIDDMLASDQPGFADPFLLAQDIPENYAVKEQQITDDQAEVTLHLFWSSSADPTTRIVKLELRQGEWKIVSVGMPFD
jgi:hypothetical protein